MFSCCWGCLYFHLPLAAQIIEKGLQIFPPLFLHFFLKSLNISFFLFYFLSSGVSGVQTCLCYTLVSTAPAPQHLTADSHRERERERGEEAGRMWKGGKGKEKEWESKRENMSKAGRSEREPPKSVKERENHGLWSGRQGGVREGRGGERLQEEVFYRGKSGKHFPLVFKERVRGRVEAQRKRHHFGSVQSQACSEKWEGFPGLAEEQKCFCKKPCLGVE